MPSRFCPSLTANSRSESAASTTFPSITSCARRNPDGSLILRAAVFGAEHFSTRQRVVVNWAARRQRVREPVLVHIASNLQLFQGGIEARVAQSSRRQEQEISRIAGEPGQERLEHT